MPESKTRTCTVEGCERPHKGRGFCEMHRARDERGAEMETPVASKHKHPTELRSRTSSGAVQIGITLQQDIAERLFEEAGDAYGAQSKLVRQAIIHFLSNRDTAYWREKYHAERAARHALQMRVNAALTSLGA